MAGEPATARLLALAEQAERCGFDSLWVGDSLLARTRHEPLTLLAALAARTERVELGTAVLLPALRNPVGLAQIVATLDRLAEGRLILGVGIAANTAAARAEFAAAGVDFSQRVGRLVHGLRLCRELWSGQPVTWDGPYWTLTDQSLQPTPHRPGGPPIWLGGSAAAALARAGRLYDGWFPVGGEVEGFRNGMDAVRQAATEAGRDAGAVTGACYVTVAIHDRPAEAEAMVWHAVGRWYLDRGHAQAALVSFKRAETSAPSDLAKRWLRLRQAKALVQLEQGGPATAILAGLIGDKKSELYRPASALLGSIYLQRSQSRKGLALLKAAVEQEDGFEWPERSEAEADLALAYLSVGDAVVGLDRMHRAQRRLENDGNRELLSLALDNELKFLEHTGKRKEASAIREKMRELEQSR